MRTKFIENLPNRTVNELDDVVDGQVSSNIRRSIAEQYINGWVNLHIHIKFEQLRVGDVVAGLAASEATHTARVPLVFENPVEVETVGAVHASERV